MTQSEQKSIFSRNLRRVLELRGMTQVELADKLDLSKTTVNSWVCEQSMPSYQKVRKIAEQLKVSPVDLTDEHGVDYVVSTPCGEMIVEVTKRARELDERQLALLLQYMEALSYKPKEDALDKLIKKEGD